MAFRTWIINKRFLPGCLIATFLSLSPMMAQAAGFQVRIVAPDALATLVNRYADVARFAAQEDVSDAEIARLSAAAPEQIRQLLATQGYFNPQIGVNRDSVDGAAERVVRITIDAGPPARVSDVALSFEGPITQSKDWPALEKTLRNAWLLQGEETFTQTAWNDAKNALLARLWADRFVSARLTDSSAQIDADANQVTLQVHIESGPEYQIGELQISGLARLPEASVRNLLNFAPGDPYTQRALLDFQERLQGSGLFESVGIDIDPNPDTAAAAPVRVRLREARRQRLVLGVGYSANAGQRVTAEYTHLNILGLQWQAKTALELAREERSLGTEMSSYPQPGRYRNLIGAKLARSQLEGYVLDTQRLRLGRTQDSDRIERLYYLQWERAKASGTAADINELSANALTANYEWVWRNVDSIIFPTRGIAVSAQTGAGLRYGGSLSGKPFGRVLGRVTAYQPFGKKWFGQARVEFGNVIAADAAGIPQSLLFRAGGDDSVRGYDYQSLGIDKAGAITGARVLATASAEIAREVAPNWLAAVFVDAGDASDRITDLRANVGVGVGARWRSPVGPLRIDVAYGEKVKRYRLHISVGIVF